MESDRITSLVGDLRESLQLTLVAVEELEKELNTGPTAVLRNALAQLVGQGVSLGIQPNGAVPEPTPFVSEATTVEEKSELPTETPRIEVVKLKEDVPEEIKKHVTERPKEEKPPTFVTTFQKPGPVPKDGHPAHGGGVYLGLNGGQFAIVDFDIYQKCRGGVWNFDAVGGNADSPHRMNQVRGKFPGTKGREARVTLHRFILPTGTEMNVVPKNGDWLDLRRKNLEAIPRGRRKIKADPVVRRDHTQYGARKEAERRSLAV